MVNKISNYVAFTPEQKERAATVDLEEFLFHQGEKLIKSGREKRLASDHSVTVRGCEWFDHASNEGGRAVSFIQKYYGKSYVEAMSMLLGESMEPVYPQAKKQKPVDQKPFAPPVPNANMHRVFAYLLKTRGLDADVVSYFARRKLLYEDAAHHNAVFIGTDEGGCPRHAHLRSTNSFGKAFRLNVESSNPRYSFHHTGTDGNLYVFVWDFLRPAHRNEPIGSTARCFRANARQWRETPLVLPSRRNKHRGGTQADKAAGVFLYSFPLIHSVHMTQPLESFCFQGIFICRSYTSKHNFFCICRCM